MRRLGCNSSDNTKQQHQQYQLQQSRQPCNIFVVFFYHFAFIQETYYTVYKVIWRESVWTDLTTMPNYICIYFQFKSKQKLSKHCFITFEMYTTLRWIGEEETYNNIALILLSWSKSITHATTSAAAAAAATAADFVVVDKLQTVSLYTLNTVQCCYVKMISQQTQKKKQRTNERKTKLAHDFTMNEMSKCLFVWKG